MGIQDRDWYREAQKERDSKTVRFGKSKTDYEKRHPVVSRGNRWAPLGIVVFWLAIMAALYLGFKQYEQPKTIISANGDVVIKRARDGHFYVAGHVNGNPVKFLVDTGATLVGVSEKFAQKAGLVGGEPTVFKTANGGLSGRIIANVPINVGPIAVSGIRVGVGLEGHDANDALLVQNFLAKFDVILRENQMILRKR
jgi:aspartyl protease family protein